MNESEILFLFTTTVSICVAGSLIIIQTNFLHSCRSLAKHFRICRLNRTPNESEASHESEAEHFTYTNTDGNGAGWTVRPLPGYFCL